MQNESTVSRKYLPGIFLFKDIVWEYQTHGGCNEIYRSKDKTLALRVPKLNSGAPDDAKRYVRLLNEVNNQQRQHHRTKILNKQPPKAVTLDSITLLHNGEEKQLIENVSVVIMPFLEKKRDPTDEELAAEIERIYAASGRIAVDAFLDGNFIILQDDTIYCLDPAYVIKVRRGSMVSDRIWETLNIHPDYIKHYDDHLFKQFEKTHPKTVGLIKNLINKELNIELTRIEQGINICKKHINKLKQSTFTFSKLFRRQSWKYFFKPSKLIKCQLEIIQKLRDYREKIEARLDSIGNTSVDETCQRNINPFTQQVSSNLARTEYHGTTAIPANHYSLAKNSEKYFEDNKLVFLATPTRDDDNITILHSTIDSDIDSVQSLPPVPRQQQ